MREIEIELHEAAANNKASVVKILLNNKNIDINLPNVLGLTPLTHAAKLGHIEIVKILLDAGADINKEDKYYRGSFEESNELKLPAKVKIRYQNREFTTTIVNMTNNYYITKEGNVLYKEDVTIISKN